VEHVFKSIEERHAHEQTCPNKAAFDRKEAATSVIYNKNKNYIEQLRDKKRELMAQYQATNAPTAQSFPLLKYKYQMNEPFVNGTNAQTQWSHDQLSFKHQRDLEPGFKLGAPIERPVKTEEEVKREREDLWC
jgi:hypothetical protein